MEKISWNKSINIIKILLLIVNCSLLINNSNAQTLTQTIRGKVIDKDNKTPLFSANIAIISQDPIMGTTSDAEGKFRIENVPVGRQTLRISYLGYETRTIPNVLLNAGKELVLEIEMTEAFTKMKEVVITADEQKEKALNEMATVSAIKFSVEETQRYAASAFDPARMVQSYAGVANSGDDLGNEIIIRGNSPRGLLWRLEGIDIPNPNHFSNPGSGGGAISMLSSSTLSNSDFFTGAYPAEYGNSTAGVFDLKFRNGNNEKREYAFMLGGLGIEASAEGPFSENSDASYLFNYRYSTLALMGRFVTALDGVLPTYQDASFKLNFPTKKYGTFGVFGVGGINQALEIAEKDSSKWETSGDGENFVQTQITGAVGLSHFLSISSKSYLKTVISPSVDNYRDESNLLIVEENYQEDLFDKTNFENYNYRGHMLFHHKFNVKSTIRTGVMFTHLKYNFKYDNKDLDTQIWTNYFNNKGNSNLIQSYGNWKYRFKENLTLTTGLHYAYLTLNKTSSIDPRMALQWNLASNKTLSLSIGKHSQHQHISTYLVEQVDLNGMRNEPNRNLEFSKAIHYVLGYDQNLTENLRVKAEVYYQSLYDVPIQAGDTSRGSLLNSSSVWDIVQAENIVSKGTGYNYGIDLTVEKFLSNGYYFLITGSLYESKFTPGDGKTYNTRYNGNYLANVLGGKEWKVGKKKDKLFAINGRLMTRGGNRFTPIDFAKSAQTGEHEIFENRLFEEKHPAYFRLDLGIKYTINKGKMTHAIMLDIQNVTNHQNIFGTFYNSELNNTETFYQTGIFPIFNYRVTF